jgi:3-oxoacyl-[acyl-carrier protein] reductase
MSELKGKVAIVTGASKGIGAGIAKELAAEGAAVVVNYASSKTGAERVVAEIKETGGTAIAVQGDVSKVSDVRRLFAETRKALGRLDVLVNNAGVYHFQPLEEVTEAEYRWHFDTNVLGPLLATQEAVKHFGPSGGTVINIGSIASTKPAAALVVYSATKGALDTMTRVLAVELASKKIRVNSVNPGYVLTEGSEAIGFDAASDAAKQMVARTAIGRPGRPDDIARIVAFLASDQSGWLTGERIEASGGYA